MGRSSRLRRGSIDYDEAEFSENGGGVLGLQLFEKGFGGGGVFGVFEKSDGIADGGAISSGNFESDFHFFGGGRVSFVNNGGVGVAGFDGGKGATHVFGGNDFGIEAAPEILALEKLFGVDAGGDGFRFGESDAFYFCVEEIVGSGNGRALVCGHDDDEGVGEETFSSRFVDEAFLIESVHLGFVGGEEDVSGRALFDLERKKAGGGEVEKDFIAGLFFVGGGNFLECVGEAGGGGDANFGGEGMKVDEGDDRKDDERPLEERAGSF